MWKISSLGTLVLSAFEEMQTMEIKSNRGRDQNYNVVIKEQNLARDMFFV